MGYNLLIGTSKEPKELTSYDENDLVSTSINSSDLNLIPGQTYTYSASKKSGSSSIRVNAVYFTDSGKRVKMASDSFEYSSFRKIVFTVPKEAVRCEVGLSSSQFNEETFSIYEEKLETGNKATPWEPHPSEDPNAPKPQMSPYNRLFQSASELTNTYQILPSEKVDYPFIVINDTYNGYISTKSTPIGKNKFMVDVWCSEKNRTQCEKIIQSLIGSLSDSVDFSTTSYTINVDYSTKQILWRGILKITLR